MRSERRRRKITAKNGTKHKVALKVEWEQHYDYYFTVTASSAGFSLRPRRRWGGERERLSRTATRRHDNWCSGVSGTDGLQWKMRREKWNSSLDDADMQFVVTACTRLVHQRWLCLHGTNSLFNWHNFFLQAHLLFPIVILLSWSLHRHVICVFYMLF